MVESSRIDFQQQLLLAIEYTVIGWYHFIHRPGSKSASMSDLLDLAVFTWKAHEHPDLPLSELPEKSISETSIKGYRSALAETFQIQFDFQSKYVDFFSSDPAVQLQRLRVLTGYYLNTRLRVFCDDALCLLLTNLQEEGPGEDPEFRRAPGLLALYYIIVFHAAARMGIPLDLRYRPVMSREVTDRRLVPLSVVHRSPYLDLVARDKKDNRIKQFPISSIVSLKSHFWTEAFKAMAGQAGREPFDYESYKKDPEYRFLRPLRRYRFRMTGYTFNHFSQSHRKEWTLVEKESPTSYVLDIVDDDWRSMLALLFEYGKFIQLLEEESLQPNAIEGSNSLPRECEQEKFPLLCAFRKRVEELRQSNPDLVL
ncbi:MAG: hypothetical protein CMN76_12795 [Spirochaetaceae bacterium]|mgnify:CR=1 FL=1|nr:hypothetical protein [Spirochaetaceae bacterium]|tara:strand:+ start:36469 stop:37575 length:1107 start_codon:yes stop_codon:yes gene_type:complete